MFRRAAVPSSALRALRALIAPASTAAQNKQPKNLQNGCCTNAASVTVSILGMALQASAAIIAVLVALLIWKKHFKSQD